MCDSRQQRPPGRTDGQWLCGVRPAARCACLAHALTRLAVLYRTALPYCRFFSHLLRHGAPPDDLGAVLVYMHSKLAASDSPQAPTQQQQQNLHHQQPQQQQQQPQAARLGRQRQEATALAAAQQQQAAVKVGARAVKARALALMHLNRPPPPLPPPSPCLHACERMCAYM